MNYKVMKKITSALTCTSVMSLNNVVCYGEEKMDFLGGEYVLQNENVMVENVEDGNIVDENYHNGSINVTSGSAVTISENILTVDNNALYQSIADTPKTYYVSADAPLYNNSENAGLSEDNPISAAQLYYPTVLKAGDTVKFRNGDRFNTDIVYNLITTDSDEEQRVTFTNYNDSNHKSDELPVFSLYKITTEDSWTQDATGNIWYIDFSDKYADYDGYRGNIDTRTTELSDSEKETYNNIGFIYNPSDGTIYGNAKASKSDLKDDYDFCREYDESSDTYRTYVYCHNNPNEDIDELYFTDSRPIFNLRSNTNIKGLRFELGGGHAISNNFNSFEGYDTNNVKIEKCEIDKIGGSYNSDGFRAGNGIELMKSGNNIEIVNNTISNCYDTATTLQGQNGNWDDVNIHNNTLKNNSQSFEIWSEVTDGNYSDHKMLNVRFKDNLCINQGRGWGYRCRPDKEKTCDIEIQHMQISGLHDAQVEISNNVFFDPVRVMYLHLTEERYVNGFKNNIIMQNNRMYLKEDTNLLYRDELENYAQIDEEPYCVNQYSNFAERYSSEYSDKKQGNCTINIGTYDLNSDDNITSMEICGPERPDFSDNRKNVEDNIELKQVIYPKEWNNDGIINLINSMHLPLDNECTYEEEYTDNSKVPELLAENGDSNNPVTFIWLKNNIESIEGAQIVQNETITDGQASKYVPDSTNGTYYYYCISNKEIDNNRIESQVEKAVKLNVNISGNSSSGDSEDTDDNNKEENDSVTSNNNEQGASSGNNLNNGSAHIDSSHGSSHSGSKKSHSSGVVLKSYEDSGINEKVIINGLDATLTNENNTTTENSTITIDNKKINFNKLFSFQQDGVKGEIGKVLENNNNYIYLDIIEYADSSKNNKINVITEGLKSNKYVYVIDSITKEPILISSQNNSDVVNLDLYSKSKYIISDYKFNALNNNTWNNKNNRWMYVKDGRASLGWINYNNKKYYCGSDGFMCVGWQKINDAWYYFNNKYDGTEGAMATGWIKNNNSWYYLNTDGKMKIGWFKDKNGKWYYLKKSGVMAIGWIKDSDGKWYYLKSDGSMAYNTSINGYKLGENGAWIK